MTLWWDIADFLQDVLWPWCIALGFVWEYLHGSWGHIVNQHGAELWVELWVAGRVCGLFLLLSGALSRRGCGPWLAAATLCSNRNRSSVKAANTVASSPAICSSAKQSVPFILWIFLMMTALRLFTSDACCLTA